MVFIRRAGLGLAVTLFSTLLPVLAVFIGLRMTLDNPSVVKPALAESGLYETVVETSVERNNEALSAVLPLDNPAILSAIQDAFPPNYIQAAAERNLDATYAWLHGATDQLTYAIDTSQPRAVFAERVGLLTEAHLNSLPQCTSVRPVPTSIQDVLALDCLPAGVPVNMAAAVARQQAQDNPLLDDIAAEAVLQSTEERNWNDQLSFVPDVYRYYTASLWVIPAILLLSTLAIIFWSISRRQGLKRIGTILLVSGFLIGILAALAVWLMEIVARRLAGSDATLLTLQAHLLEAARLLCVQLRNWLAGIGGGYAVVGLLAFAIVALRARQDVRQNEDLNESLGYSANIPSAGTTFDPGDKKKD